MAWRTISRATLSDCPNRTTPTAHTGQEHYDLTTESASILETTVSYGGQFLERSYGEIFAQPLLQVFHRVGQ